MLGLLLLGLYTITSLSKYWTIIAGNVYYGGKEHPKNYIHTCIDETHAGECVVVWREEEKKRSSSARYNHNKNNHNSSRSITTGTYLQGTRTTLIILCSIIVYENKSFLAF